MAFNVNKARAQRREARGGDDFEFELDGETFTIPYEVGRKTVKALKALEGDDVDGTLAALVGPEQWKKLSKLDYTLQDFRAISDAYKEESGLDLGESPASTSS